VVPAPAWRAKEGFLIRISFLVVIVLSGWVLVSGCASSSGRSDGEDLGHTSASLASCSDGAQDDGQQGIESHSPATKVVTVGETSQSAHYKSVFTFGQQNQNQGTSTSSHSRIQGRLVGANRTFQ
jgi:hypothetical protein